MRRRKYGQYHRVIKHLIGSSLDLKQLAWASVALLAISSGVSVLTTSTQPSKPQTITPSSNSTVKHPLLEPDAIPTAPSNIEQLSPSQDIEPPAPHSSEDGAKQDAQPQISVTINGESIEIPPSGSSHQSIKNQDGSNTEVTIQHEQTHSEGNPGSSIIIDSRSTSGSTSSSLNSRITITH